jgi:hypothetical protein
VDIIGEVIIGMMEYKGYLVLGRAQVIHPSSPDWRSQGIVFTNTPQGSFMIKRLDGAVYHSKRAAEAHGLKLGKKWIDENPKQGVE